MEEEYQIIYMDQLESGIIGQGIIDYNKQHVEDPDESRLCFILRAPDQEIVGGIKGVIYWNWLHISLLWVKDDLRGRGYGSRLLAHAEEEARQRGAKNVYLDTFSFQAPDFYKKYGYQVFGELDEFPPGNKLYYFRKRL